MGKKSLKSRVTKEENAKKEAQPEGKERDSDAAVSVCVATLADFLGAVILRPTDPYINKFFNTKQESKTLMKMIRQACNALVQSTKSEACAGVSVAPVDVTSMIASESRRLGFTVLQPNGNIVINTALFSEVLLGMNPYMDEVVNYRTRSGLTSDKELYVVLSTAMTAPFISCVSDMACFVAHKCINSTCLLMYFRGNYLHFPKREMANGGFIERTTLRWMQDVINEEDMDDSQAVDECPICMEVGVPLIICGNCMSTACVLCTDANASKCHVCKQPSRIKDSARDVKKTGEIAEQIWKFKRMPRE